MAEGQKTRTRVKTWLIVFLGVLGVLAIAFLAVWFDRGTRPGPDDHLTPVQKELLEQANVRKARLDTLYMTVVGPGVTIGDYASEDDGQQRVPQDKVEENVDETDGRAFLRMGVEGREAWGFSMDTLSVDEGRLFRIHVARVEGDTCGVEAIVMGFYDKMWSDKAVGRQALPCIRCGHLWVCGSNPSCED